MKLSRQKEKRRQQQKKLNLLMTLNKQPFKKWCRNKFRLKKKKKKMASPRPSALKICPFDGYKKNYPVAVYKDFLLKAQGKKKDIATSKIHLWRCN